MARTDAGTALTAAHHDRQTRIRADVMAAFADVWPRWELSDPDSMDDVAQRAVGLVRDAHRESASVAADYWGDFRRAEQVEGAAAAQVADRPDRDELRALIRGAGLSGVVNARRRGGSMDVAMRNGLVKATGTVARMALTGGRQTVLGSIDRDPQARGWQRVGAGNPCRFCAMLISRGPAYRGQATAGFRAHDHCRCVAEPSYSGEPTDQARQFRDQWNEAQRRAREAGDLQRGTANDALNAFRRYQDA